MNSKRTKKITNILLLILLIIYILYTLIIGFNLYFEYLAKFLFILLIFFRGALEFKN